jgi:6,7-dimethyl-8-ribityllumazine synthase
MASGLKNLSTYKSEEIPSGKKFKIAIVQSLWNEEVTSKLREGCIEALLKHGVKEKNIYVSNVPGAYELPLGALHAEQCFRPDAVICLGCVVKGETKHDEYINNAVAQGLMSLNLEFAKPFIFGLLTPNNQEQALERAGGKHGNKGVEAAITALQMIRK